MAVSVMTRLVQRAAGLLLFAAAFSNWAQAQSPKGPAADLLLRNGHIFTSNPAHPWAKAMAIRGSKIVAMGSDKDVEGFRGPHTKVMDLGGRMAMPGIIDSHIHFLEGSLSLDQFALDDAYAIPEIMRRVKDFAAAHPERKWLLGRGWLYEPFKPSGLPTKQILDEIVPNRPVVIDCYDGHSIWVNSKALALAGITRDTPDPRKGDLVTGTIVKDPSSGDPTGVLKEGAVDLVRRVIPEPTREEKLEAVRRGLKEANRHGLTSVVNASGSISEMDLYDQLRCQGELTVRMRTALMMVPHLDEKTLDMFEEGRRRFHDEWLRGGVIKAFMDGVIESHTAAMLSPYTDDPKLIGSMNYTPEQFKSNVLELDRRHFQVMTHAIGDRSVRTVLDAYQAAEEANGPRDRRFRIEHIETVDPADIPRFGRLHVIASMQPYHCYPEPNLLNIWARNIGPARLPYSFAWRDLAAAGAKLAFGSDWPVVSLDPFIGIQNAVTRQDDSGNPPGGWVGNQKITLDQALAAYTRVAAYAEFNENLVGSLEKGKLADVIVLSQDLFAIKPLEIRKTTALMTIVGGKIVYGGQL
jgi:predicted amidohydrolase YtcJ